MVEAGSGHGEHLPTCSRCREPRDRVGQRYCRRCHNELERERQKVRREDLRRLRKIIRGVPIGTFA